MARCRRHTAVPAILYGSLIDQCHLSVFVSSLILDRGSRDTGSRAASANLTLADEWRIEPTLFSVRAGGFGLGARSAALFASDTAPQRCLFTAPGPGSVAVEAVCSAVQNYMKPNSIHAGDRPGLWLIHAKGYAWQSTTTQVLP